MVPFGLSSVRSPKARQLPFKSLLTPALVCTLLMGCSGQRDRYEVQGVLTYRGTPLPEVELLMSPVDGRRGSSTSTDKEGRFTMQYTGTKTGVPAGEQIVHFRYWPEDPQQGQAYLEGRVKIEGLIGEALEKYGERDKSPRRLMVEQDLTDLQLDLE